MPTIKDMLADLAALENAIAAGGPLRELARDVVLVPATKDLHLIVSTVMTLDEGPETAILDLRGTYPVERYATEAQALAGHKKWVDFLKDGNRQITRLGYGSMIGPEEVTLEPGGL